MKSSVASFLCRLQGQDSESKITSAAPAAEKPTKEEWAVMVNVTEPVRDFHKRVPDMAHEVSQGNWQILLFGNVYSENTVLTHLTLVRR